MATEPLLPIKVVFPSVADYQVDPGRNNHTEHVEVTTELRESLASQAEGVEEHFEGSFEEFPGVPGIARVQLLDKAIAKTHRPTALFNEDTCPVVGASGAGELLVGVTPDGLRAVAGIIREGDSEEAVAHISAVKSISAWTSDESAAGLTGAEILQQCESRSQTAVRCELFWHGSPGVDDAILRHFGSLLDDLELPAPSEVRYTSQSLVYSVQAESDQQLDSLARFPGVRSLTAFAKYEALRSAATVLGPLTAVNLPPPVVGREYGVVGVIDTGTDPDNPFLQAWVQERLDLVPRERQNNEHGSFVSGLIAGARALNHGDTRFPGVGSRVVDVAAIGENGIDEDDLIAAIDRAVDEFPEVKVWNLSLGGDVCCDEEKFSPLAAALDERSKLHSVLFVVAAGNYEILPLRPWPAPAGLVGDRICPPADSIRSLTVGSTAHRTTAVTLVAEGEPSPFSRRGPAPGFLLKPELSHYGGNCCAQGTSIQAGVVSVNGCGSLAESIGTSFAAPLVAATAASIHNELSADPGGCSPVLVKGLALHSALLKGQSEDLRTMHYQGAGVPGDAEDVVGCTQSSATVIFQIPLTGSGHFEKRPFPMPTCLVRNGTLSAEVFMTMAHDCPLEHRFDFESCRSNVTASLGTWRPDGETGNMRQNREVFPVPKSIEGSFEGKLIEHGHKWSPFKLYYRKFSRGPTQYDWRLRLNRLDRKEFTETEEQQVFLIVTVRDPAGAANVYDEIVRSMNQYGWAVQDLPVRSRERLQG